MQTPTVLHNSLDTLILNDFIQIHVKKKFELLVITGQASPEQIAEAWEAIQEDFMSRMISVEAFAIFHFEKELAIINSKIALVGICLQVLEVKRSDAAVKELAAMGYRRPFNWNDRAAYEADLKAVESRSKTLLERRKTAEDRLKQARRPISERATKTVEDWDMDLAILSKYMGYRLDKKVITVSEFLNISALYSKELERQQEALNK
jgi:hypothetical protein